MKLLARPAQPRQQPKSCQGTEDRVPCPHCGRAIDFRELGAQQLLDTGHEVVCRNDEGEGCGQMMVVVGIRVVKVIAVKPVLGVPVRRDQRPAQEARTMSPAQLQRYLKG